MELVLVGVIFIIFFLLRSWLTSPTRIGSSGEARVARRLRSLPDEEFISIHDLLIPASFGTSQIDHIVIARCGVFVIETKNMAGWIHGHERSEYWTQSIYHDQFKIRNPVKQNWAHIYALKEILQGFPPMTFHPIVVFAGKAELKHITSTTPVIYASELRDRIKGRCTSAELTISQMQTIAQRLRQANLEGKEVRKNHTNQVQIRVARRNRSEQSLVCPKCGGQLILRRGPYGEFLGCSNYPRCRYTNHSS